jgi:hypothetical protein
MPVWLLPALINFGISKAMGASTKNALLSSAAAAVLPGAGGGASALQGGAGGGIGSLFAQGAGPIGFTNLLQQGVPQLLSRGNPLAYAGMQFAGQQLFPGAQPNLSGIDDLGQLGYAPGTSPKGPLGGITDMIPKSVRDFATSDIGKFTLLSSAAPLVSGIFGGDDKQTMKLPLPNQGYSKLVREGVLGPTSFMRRDYTTGQDVPLEDRETYRVVEDVLGNEPTQTFKAIELNQGGIVSVAKFNEGGQVLPSKYTHDENDINNYARANGFVIDGSGNGEDEKDTMLAQLADGEFVSRAHAVLGAGIIAGANINDKNDQRKKGAEFFYEQQKRFKRVYELLDASRKATRH